MKIIISPAKVQNGADRIELQTEKIPFPIKTKELYNLLVDMSKTQMGKLMKIKDKLLDTTYDMYQNPVLEQHAITLYNGIVFKEINAHLLDSAQLMYLNEHLRILSAYYGVLKPLTAIQPYRLDMTMKPDKINLYQYWNQEVNAYFDEEETIINLASLEFSQMIKKNMINIHFKEEQSDGQLKVVTVRAKKARGLMVQYMADHMIYDPQDLVSFNEMNYSYSKDMSDDNNYVFIAPYEL